HADAQRYQPRPPERRPDAVAKGGGIADVAANQQAIALGDGKDHPARRVDLVVALDGYVDLERQRAGLRWHTAWPIADIAGKRPPVAVGGQIEPAVAAIAGAARGDDLDEAAEPALGILLGKTGDLGIKGRLGLPLDKIGAGPIDKKQN